MKKIFENLKNIKDIDISGTLDQIINSIKRTNNILLIIIGIVLISLPMYLEIILLVFLFFYFAFRNMQLKTNKEMLQEDLKSIQDLVIITSEKMILSDYSIKIKPKNWEATLGKVDVIKIIFIETELGARLQAHVIYKNGDKNEINLPKKSYFLESEFKELILL